MRKRRRRYLILAAILVGLPLLYLMEERVRGEWLLARITKELRAKGEKLTVEELIPPVPEETKVVVLTPEAAAALFDLGPMAWGKFPGHAEPFDHGKAMVSWQRQEWLDMDDQPCTWEDYLGASETRRDKLPGLRQQLTNQVLHFQPDYAGGPAGLLLRHLAPCKSACQALCQAASCDLRAGNLQGATDNLHAAARLVAHLESEPLMISQLVRMAVAAITTRALWEALQADGWTDAQLARLQSDWESVRFTPAMLDALRMERALVRTLCPGGRHYSRKDLRSMLSFNAGLFGEEFDNGLWDQLPDAVSEAIAPVLKAVRIELWTHVWAPHDQRVLIEAQQELVDLGRHAIEQHRMLSVSEMPVSGTNLAGEPLLANRLRAQSSRQIHTLLAAEFSASCVHSLAKCARAEAWNKILVTAIALKRFQRKHGHWPENLAKLVPEFLPEVPIDWMDGQPLRYRLREDGTFVLYSVGEDGIDQGGEPDRSSEAIGWQRDQDFVWPQPAPMDEVATADAEAVAEATVREAKGSASSAARMDIEMMKRYGLLPQDAAENSDDPSDAE
jgi:hypothetical protein